MCSSDLMPVAEQVAIIFAGNSGQLDDIPVRDIRLFEAEYLDFMRKKHSALLDKLTKKGDLDDELRAELKATVAEFKPKFRTSGSKA